MSGNPTVVPFVPMARPVKDEEQPLIRTTPTKSSLLRSRTFQVGLALTFGVAVVLVVSLTVSNNAAGTNNGQVLRSGAIPTSSAGNGEEVNPVVTLSMGKVKGVQLQSRLGRSYSAFYHLPYAQPPLGKLRFQSPRPFTEKWDGIRDATQRGDSQNECIQIKGNEVGGTEDCLKISIFTPQLPQKGQPNPNLPVMFYILGGAYLFGRSNRYGAGYMMDEDVILVFIDFRYGAFGHLSTEDMEIRGNMAFKDQVMALKWVQEHIAKFGGDPKRVLIFGNSSGAASVHAHIISNMSNGLFSRAVSQSGSVFLDAGYRTRPGITAQNLGRHLNCSDVQDSAKLHQCLIDANPAQIAKHFSILPDTHVMVKEAIPEGGDLSQVFFEDMPSILVEQGRFKKVPWIVGSNSAEAFFSADGLLLNELVINATNALWDFAAPPLFHFKDDKDHNASHALRDFYFHGQPISKQTRQGLSDCLSDIEWVHPVYKAASLHAKHDAPVYYYWLTHEPIQSYGESTKQNFPPPYGVAHADEVQFFYPFDPFPLIDEKSSDFKFSADLIKIWTSFARTGIPSVPTGVEWSPLNADPQLSFWMELNEKNYQPVDPLKDRMTFLDNFPLQDPNYEYRQEM